MSDMPRPRKPYTQLEIDRYGNKRWYYRKGKGKRYRLPGKYESEEWLDAYKAAEAGQEVETPKYDKRSFRWLCEQYYKSADFAGLKKSTQQVRRNVLKVACETGGNLHFRQVDRKIIAAGRDRRAATPSAAVNYMKIMGYVFEWAVDAGHLNSNPVRGVKKPKLKTKGLEPWTEKEVIQYLEAHKIGSMAYLAMTLFLWTGLSRADAWQVGPQHVKDGVLTWDRDKTGVDQYIPILPPLQAAIDAYPKKHLAFLLNDHGRPFKSAPALGNKFAKWCIDAEVGKRAHGLRKLSATLLAENDGTHSQLRAMYGWKSDKMPSYYTQSANAKKMALQAGEKLKENILYPHFEVGEGEN